MWVCVLKSVKFRRDSYRAWTAPASPHQVKNLGPMVSNELLHRAFSIFGTVERATVLVEGERPRSKGEGLVEVLSKKVAQEAFVACQEGHFVLTRSMVPVVVEPYEVS